MKKILRIMCLLICVVSFACLGTGCKNASKEIAIIQYVPDIPLDKCRTGIIDSLKAGGYIDGENVKISIYNCNADASTVVQSVKTAAKRSDLIFAIATPVAQVLVKELEKLNLDTPVLFTAVTDPVASGIIKDLKNPGGNVSGTSDLNAVDKQIALAKELIPDIKKVGFIYTAGEHNSIVQLDLARQAASALGIEIVSQAVTNETELKTASQSLASSVEAIYLPTDNKVAASCNVVVNEANLLKVPTIAGEASYLGKGATITCSAVDYYELGTLTGSMGVKILNEGVSAGSLPVGYVSNDTLEINVSTAEKYGIKIPESLKAKADKIL